MEPVPKHVVLLQQEVSLFDLEAIGPFFRTIVTSSEVTYAYLLCSKIDTSHFLYLDAQVCLPESDGEAHLMIPHRFVLSISDFPDAKRKLGFT